MLTIFDSDHWIVTHRKDSRYPGFLIVASKNEASDISGLDSRSLSDLGNVLAKTESLLLSYYKPHRVITAKLGFTPGHSCHFHVLPVSIGLMNEIEDHPSYENEPDGSDALLFACREYGERELTDDEFKVQLETVKQLREHELTRCSNMTAYASL